MSGYTRRAIGAQSEMELPGASYVRRTVPSGSRARVWKRPRRDCDCQANATQAQDASSTLHVGGFRDVDRDASLPRLNGARWACFSQSGVLWS